jgi:ferredoxin
MADRTNKWEDNAAGAFYVDKECIFCNLCRDIAPANFKEADSEDHDVVFRQPGTDEELEQSREAVVQCPVDAIGEDG